MNRRAAIRLLTGVACLSNFTGCLHDGEWSFEKVLGWDDPQRVPKVKPASMEVAKRVDDLGKRIVEQNTFTGLDPIFHTIGVPESILFHRGGSELFVSAGLIQQCKTDPELAAVLCSELGQMMAEKRAGRAVGHDGDSPHGALAYQDKPDAGKLAKELLRGAGFEPGELDRVEPLLKQSDRGAALQKQMAGSAPPPTWNR